MPVKPVRLFLLIGCAIIGAAVFAEAIGLDNDPGWGKGRVALLVFGIVIIVSAFFYALYTDTVLSISHKLQPRLSQSINILLAFARRDWCLFPILILVIVVYVWFASSGSWTRWEPATHYYAELANSFKQGQLYLLAEPNRELLSLSNPYDPNARQGVYYFIDYSLYKGKYYLYWGPVPALLLMLVDPFTRGRVADLYLVFYFISGIFLLQSLLIITVWDRFFRDVPNWILGLSISAIGLTTPWTYMLINEPNGRIYEAAVSGAQFFLLAGLLVAVLAFSKSVPSTLSLLLTSSLWALAIGTRLVLVVPIATMILMLVYRIWRTTRGSLMSMAPKLISLGFPLLLSLIGWGWYNWSRFDSVTETGFSYALAGVNLSVHNELFSPIYILQNLYAYIFQPPAGMAQFPFLYPKEMTPVTGLLIVAPFTMFALLPTSRLLLKATQGISSTSAGKKNSNSFLDWIILILLGAFSSAFFLILMFFWIAVRYAGDFMPALSLLAILGFWQGYQLLRQKKTVYRKVYSALGIILITASIVVSLLLSLAVKQLGRTGF